MVFEHIEKLKQEYTGQYVAVDSQRPELARFAGATGRVKTINFNGCALVQFEDIGPGWYDIELDYLKVVDRPEPKAAEVKAKPAAKKSAPKNAEAPAEADTGEKLSRLELARMQKEVAKPPLTSGDGLAEEDSAAEAGGKGPSR